MLKKRNIFFGAALLVFCVAAAEESSAFRKTAAALDPDGEYYELSRSENSVRYAADFFRRLKRGIDDADIGDEQRQTLNESYRILRKAVALAGLREIVATGASSVKLPSGIYRNRRVLTLEKDPAGMLWLAPVAQNTPEIWSFGECTVPCSAFCVVFLDFSEFSAPCVVSTLFGENDPDGKKAEQWRKIVGGLSGMWSIFRFPNGQSILRVPDEKGAFFDWLKSHIPVIGAPDPKNGKIRTLLGISLLWMQEYLYVSFPGSERNGTDVDPAETPLEQTEKFRRLRENLPDDGVAAFYITSERDGEPTLLFGAPCDLSGPEIVRLGVIRRTDDGFALVSHSSASLNAETTACTFSIAGKTLYFVQAFLSSVIAACEEDDLPEPQHEFCKENLQNFYRVLCDYKAKKGTFPKELHLKGISELDGECPFDPNLLVCPDCEIVAPENKPPETADLNECCYVYFGDWGDLADGKMPLVIDQPGNHRESFNVLYCDGTAETLEAENATSVRKQTSFLQTVRQYDETRFVELMKRSEEIDKTFGWE